MSDSSEPTPRPEERRLAIAYMDRRVLADLLAGRCELVAPGVPEGASVFAVDYEWQRNALAVMFEHESFAPVAMGQLVPELAPGVCRVVRVESDKEGEA